MFNHVSQNRDHPRLALTQDSQTSSKVVPTSDRKRWSGLTFSRKTQAETVVLHVKSVLGHRSGAFPGFAWLCVWKLVPCLFPDKKKVYLVEGLWMIVFVFFLMENKQKLLEAKAFERFDATRCHCLLVVAVGGG